MCPFLNLHITNAAVTFSKSNVIGAVACTCLSASEIILTVQMFGFCHILKGSENMLVIQFFMNVSTSETVTEVVLS